MNSYALTRSVTLTATFADEDTLVAYDPGSVVLKVTDPDGVTTSYSFAAAEITQTAPGAYEKTIVPDKSGFWTYEWEAVDAFFEAFSEPTRFYIAISA